MNDAISTIQAVVTALGPFAGLYLAAKIIIGFQRTVVDGALGRTTVLEERLASAEGRVDALEDEVNQCDRRNAQLVRIMLAGGLDVPRELYDPPKPIQPPSPPEQGGPA